MSIFFKKGEDAEILHFCKKHVEFSPRLCYTMVYKSYVYHRLKGGLFMDIRMQGRAVSLLYHLFLKGSTGAHQIPYAPAKTHATTVQEAPPLLSPETLGISSAALDSMLSALERERAAFPHTLALSRAGKLCLSAAAPGYHPGIRHQTHSMCKTVTGLCIGMLVDEGRLDLDTPAYRLVATGLPPLLSPRTKAITVRHLLTMTAGVSFAEVGAVTEVDWVRSFFESAVSFTPGTRFSYNSMNSYILSVILERITGMTLLEFATSRLFEPLGIHDVFWEACPMGHTKGGWGLYLSVFDMLKLGEVVLNGGTYQGVRLLSRHYMRMMLKPHAKTPEGAGDYDYGFHIWIARDRSAYLFNGMLGQNIWIHPKNGLVLAVNAGNCELFQTGPMLPLLSAHLSPRLGSASLKPNRSALRALREHEKSFFSGRSWTHATSPQSPLGGGATQAERFALLEEKPYFAERNNFGILPLFVMMMQNNLAAGIRSLTFSHEGEDYFVTLHEGEEIFRLPLGFSEYRQTSLTVRGEAYLVACRAEFCDDTDGEPILKLEILFPEMASSRRMCLYYDTDKPTLVLSEQPGRHMMEAFLQLIDFMPHGKVIGNIVRSQVEKELIAYRIRACYEPTLRLDRDAAPVEEAPTEEAAEELSEPTSPPIPASAKRVIPILKRKP